MAPLAAKTLRRDALPVIDIAGLSSDDAGRRRAVGREIRAACEDKGFVYIAGHGVDPGLVAEMFAQARRFFALPLERKAALDKTFSRARHGYEPLGGQRLEDGSPPDLKESYFIGREIAEDDPRFLRGEFGRGRNQWPDLPGFRPVAERYFETLDALAALMYRGLALSLDLDEHYFDGFYTDPMNVLRMIHYPPQPADPLPGQKGIGAHTDFGGMTLLAQDAVGGLQVWDEAAGWIDATPIENSFVVNLGDFVARWTNDRYRSTRHRVVNLSGKERYSIPFFANGAPHYEVSCIPTCLRDGVANYPPTSIAEHFSVIYRRVEVAR